MNDNNTSLIEGDVIDLNNKIKQLELLIEHLSKKIVKMQEIIKLLTEKTANKQ